MRVLVTGGRGFIGTHVCEALVAAGHEAIALGRADGDLAVPGVADTLVDEHRPDVVVHLAAVMPDDARLAQNAAVTALVAEACAEHGVRLVHGSTSSVYADETPYADSKRASEEAAGGATILRFAFPYGPGQRRGAIPTMLKQAIAVEPVVVYRGWKRSFCYAGDIGSAVALLLEQDGVFDVGRDDDLRTLAEIAVLACRATGASEELIELRDPPAGPAPVLQPLDLGPLRALGWQPAVELDDGIRRTLDWLLSPPA